MRSPPPYTASAPKRSIACARTHSTKHGATPAVNVTGRVAAVAPSGCALAALASASVSVPTSTIELRTVSRRFVASSGFTAGSAVSGRAASR